ncbi:membrane protein insertase YidC [Bacillus coahuilensis]|uniref:membrane protein insertase YidC n=1 Tax=Bacillus coahuilensis TaxID=408580 RepID=UPI0001850D40|nr:membrane protein insertase YidC [Bacillus coahuilensis]
MKKWSTILLLIGTTVLLSGCGATNQEGFFYDTFVFPFAKLLEWLGNTLGGNFGLAIIIITIIIRLVLMPFMLKTFKNQQEMKGKMDKLKPEMQEIQKKLKETKDTEEQRKLQQEMMQLYQKHGVNPLNMGCLPLIIQMPILLGLYYAIIGSPDIATHTFLWFNLGEANIIMALIAGVVYFGQAKVSLIGIAEEQLQQMKIISYLSPVMILIFSLNAPAALPLYWTVGGVFVIGQTLFAKKYYQAEPTLNEEKA